MTPPSVVAPSDLGAPARFAHWRPLQALAFSRLVHSEKRIDGMALPTGVGKGLVGWSYAKLMGMRAVILTSTLALQDQYQRDLNLLDVRGMSHYPCRILLPGPYWKPNAPAARCDVGPCLDGESCIYLTSGCAYFDKVRAALESDEPFVTSYAWWMAHPEAKRDLIICDEAHELPGIVTRAAGVSFSSKDVALEPAMTAWGLGDWAGWADDRLSHAERLLESIKLSGRERRDVRSLRDRFMRLSRANLDDWGVDFSMKGVSLEPIQPRAYTETLLFRGASRVILMSATLRPAMLQELGLGLNQYQFHETDSPFPLANRPIYWVKTVRLNDKTTQVNRAFWANRIDQIIAKRLDRKGIIHTVSYARARELQAMSRYADLMLLHDARSTRDVIAQFRQAKAPCILVSPSVTTGVDFPYQDAEYQIIAKVPFPNTSTGLSCLRAEADKLWLVRTTCATLVQMSGRIVRGPGDVGETLIVDDTVNWLESRYKPFLPMWWRAAYKPVAAPPLPPRKI